MDSIVPLRENVFWLGVNDRESDLFEGIWPLPYGVAYNAYLIRDEKTALVDTVKAGSSTAFVERLSSLLSGRPLDYLIVNHLEPDHSGTIKLLRTLYPQVEIIGNRKTAEFLVHLYQVQTKVKMVEDGERISLGSRTLQFHLIPMVHWPETMVAYDEREKILFSTDAFGAFGTHDGGIFDDQLDHARFEGEMLRYFSNIVAKYCVMVQKALVQTEAVGNQHDRSRARTGLAYAGTRGNFTVRSLESVRRRTGGDGRLWLDVRQRLAVDGGGGRGRQIHGREAHRYS